jgi:hypothetical protein
MLGNLMTIVNAAGLPDPSDWNVCGNDGRVLLRSEELTADRVAHLRGKIEVEIEDRLVRFDLQEDENPEVTLRHLFRRMGVTQENWQIVNLRGESLPTPTV